MATKIKVGIFKEHIQDIKETTKISKEVIKGVIKVFKETITPKIIKETFKKAIIYLQ